MPILLIDRDAERIACRRAATDTAAFKMADARAVLASGLAFIDLGRSNGIGGAFLSDFARGLHDELSSLWAAHDRILDDAGLVPLMSLDLSELEAVIAGEA